MLGIILFGVIGALALFAIDSIPYELIDNAATFGVLCVLCVLVFIADLLVSPGRAKRKHDSTQTPTNNNKAYASNAMLVHEKEQAAANKGNNNWRSPTPQMTELRNSASDSLAAADHTDEAERQLRELSRYYRSKPPQDEVDDAPPFPASHEATVFKKMSMPSVKIMRVERGDDGYRRVFAT